MSALLSSELLKLRTTRPPYVLIAVIMLISAIGAAGLVGTGALGDDEDPALSLAQAAAFGGILALILGILIVTNEYRHGTVNSTYLVEPRRPRVLFAKAIAAVIAGAAIAAGAAAAALAVALPWLAARDESFPLDAHLGGAALRLFLAYALYALLGLAVGAIIQNQVGAIVGALIWFFVIENVISVVAGLLSDGVGEPDPVSKFLPGSVLQGILGFSQGEGAQDFLLDALPATLLAALYAAGLLALGALAVTRRDP